MIKEKILAKMSLTQPYYLTLQLKKTIKKIGEESAELIYAINQNDKKKLIHEFADLLYHLVVLSKISNISIDEIMDELLSRTKLSGLVEKENRKK